MAEKKFTVYCTHHGPIIREAERQMGQHPPHAGANQGAHSVLHPHQGERLQVLSAQTMELKANSSNNTIFADADGDIAYFHGNFIPRRDTSFDFTKPVDGSNPATEWKGLLTVDETPATVEPEERLALQLQQLALVRRRREQPPQGRLPRLRRNRHRIRAWASRHPSPARQKGLHARLSDRRGLRQLSPLVRETDPRADQCLGRRPALRSAESKTGRSDRSTARWDYRWGVDFRPHLPRRLLGRRHPPPLRRRRRKAGISVEEYIGTKAPAASPPRNRSPRPPTGSSPTSEPGRRHGATSIASNASLATLSSPSTTPLRASPSASPHRSGARSLRSEPVPIPEQRSGMAPAATASSPWSSSAKKCARRP